jgi:hypothetical protein
MAAHSTANKTNDIARHTPFVALRKPFAPFLCSLLLLCRILHLDFRGFYFHEVH